MMQIHVVVRDEPDGPGRIDQSIAQVKATYDSLANMASDIYYDELNSHNRRLCDVAVVTTVEVNSPEMPYAEVLWSIGNLAILKGLETAGKPFRVLDWVSL